MTDVPEVDPIQVAAVLAEPTRRGLYDVVVGRHEPIGRDEAATALGISRELAAFHLDRLVDAGLLATEYRRLTGRTGPGAGRPAKLYRRAGGDIEFSLPQRHYERAAELMATALERLGSATGLDAVARTAHERGRALGADADAPGSAETSGGRGSVGRLLALLRGAGYEPEMEPAGDVCLRNCPYDALVQEHRDVTCGMNLAWAQGVVEGLGASEIGVELNPEPGRCCVLFHPTETAEASSGRSGPTAGRAPTG
jgi:predicted ArsR family transcriptional regulator